MLRAAAWPQALVLSRCPGPELARLWLPAPAATAQGSTARGPPRLVSWRAALALRSPSRNAGCFGATPHLTSSTFYHLSPTAARSPTPPTAPDGRSRSGGPHNQIGKGTSLIVAHARTRRQKMQRAARGTATTAQSPRAAPALPTRPPRAQAAPKRPATWKKWLFTRRRARRSSPTS